MTQQIITLLELRNQIKNKKPRFIRQDYQRRKRLGRKLKWRKPKGIHSKIRHGFKGHRRMPSPGYKSPKMIRGFHASGLKHVAVFSLEEVSKIKKEIEGIVISKNVGAKKRLVILKKAKELNVRVLNLNADSEIKKIEDFINSKKKIPVKETKKEEVKKEKEAKENAVERKSEEDKKEAEKKEKDKLLTKKA
ncbi:50S ribosomal protein L32e [Candidatus Woesearchaeota archaeon]|nr:50S ribosomal protein L32e [Candidatus Woesearchaeota archaeon]